MKTFLRSTCGELDILNYVLALSGAVSIWATSATAQAESGFTPLFDGETLNGWTLVGNKTFGGTNIQITLKRI